MNRGGRSSPRTSELAAAEHVLNHPLCARMIGALQSPNQLENVKRIAAGGAMNAARHIVLYNDPQHLVSDSCDCVLAQQIRTHGGKVAFQIGAARPKHQTPLPLRRNARRVEDRRFTHAGATFDD